MVFETDVKDGVLRMNCLGSVFGFTVEDSDVVMARVIEKLIEEKRIVSVVLAETREYEYDYDQTRMLKEIANIITVAVKERKLLSVRNIAVNQCSKYLAQWYGWIRDLVTSQLRGDPIGAYVNLIREIRHLKTKMVSDEYVDCIKHYLENCLLPLKDMLDNAELIDKSKPYISGYHIGDRSLYRRFFKPTIRPNFMYTKFMAQPPPGETVARYKVGDTDVEIFKVPGKVRYIYHAVPPEFKLNEDEYNILDAARRILEERRPKELEITEQARMREIFHTLSLDLLRDLAEEAGKNFEPGQMEKLASILTRYTAGLGILEVLLKDDKIQDVYINSPMGNIPVYVYHQDYEECETNLVPTREDGDRWATRFKLMSGRPLDEANPVLDSEFIIPGGVARVAAINPRLSPDGLGFALRRHRFKPWTFPLFIKEGYFDPLFGGLLWFVTSYGRTVLVAGTRGAGKSSLLGSMMLQVLPYYRIVTSEDTLELPVEQVRALGYNIERLKSRSVITRVELELPAEEVIRTSLRLGDSCLFIGEIRSTEAKALFEAMRIGAMANIVAGTVHGDSAYGVFDRIINDLGVPATSFKAVDFIVVCNKLKTSDGLRTFRRVTEITEVRKHWKKDPDDEGGFVNLMEYDSSADKLKPTDTLLNGESVILNQVASNVPGWAGRWDYIWDNIKLRARILETIVSIAEKNNKLELLEAETTVKVNQMFHTLCEKSRKEFGHINSDEVFKDWLEWFKAYAGI
ncbi:MAG: type II/IV secretion system ATPase subunit [Candidatus Aenigmarchaeota archaeon]|nr:type II/IV secretion system ATPase subunit [Candidatus Aenigmarchaeota archaeon]